MRTKRFFFSLTFLLFFQSHHIAFSTNKYAPKKESSIKQYYQQLLLNNKNLKLPSQSAFEVAMTGYLYLKENAQLNEGKQLLSIIDFSKKSSEKRFWLIDLKQLKVLYHSLVAHGRNTGIDVAKYFSNTPSSYRSSLGFYTTGATYFGKHGLSLYLHGQDRGFNDKAKERAIVMHGADYVSEKFVETYGRLGRSLGCPALPMSNYKEIINTIKDGTCLFIYYPSQDYLKKSTVLTTANQNKDTYLTKAYE